MLQTKIEAAPEALPDWLSRRPITVDEYHHMGEVGILTRDDRVELIEGQIIQMAPIGSPHAGNVNRLNRLLFLALGDRAVLSVQCPVRLSLILEPVPDFSILKPKANDYADALPTAADVLLLIEVSDTSLAYDRGVKARLYAKHGIGEYWIVDVKARSVVVHREPAGQGYASVWQAGAGDVLEMLGLPGVRMAVDEVFR